MPLLENEIALKFKTSEIRYLIRGARKGLQEYLISKLPSDIEIPDEIPHELSKRNYFHLLGVQFFFNNKYILNEYNQVIEIETDKIKLSQLYFNSESKSFYRYNHQVNLKPDREPSRGNYITEIGIESAYKISDIDNNDLKYGLEAEPVTGVVANNILSNLSFAKNDDEEIVREFAQVGLVFFPLSAMKFLCDNFENMILSGSMIKLGKKLNHFSEDTLNLYNDEYFTLKIEGNNPINGMYSDSTEITDEDSLEQAGPVVVVGYACPPDWHAFSSFASTVQRVAKVPMSQIVDIQKKWRQYIVHEMKHNANSGNT